MVRIVLCGKSVAMLLHPLSPASHTKVESFISWVVVAHLFTSRVMEYHTDSSDQGTFGSSSKEGKKALEGVTSWHESTRRRCILRATLLTKKLTLDCVHLNVKSMRISNVSLWFISNLKNCRLRLYRSCHKKDITSSNKGHSVLQVIWKRRHQNVEESCFGAAACLLLQHNRQVRPTSVLVYFSVSSLRSVYLAFKCRRERSNNIEPGLLDNQHFILRNEIHI